uniref:Uncharacterized protein n=1 Tax=Rhizophora mucronata TaxID=61149 RepID=A0A2P2IHX3_RHIMU
MMERSDKSMVECHTSSCEIVVCGGGEGEENEVVDAMDL